MADGPFDTWLDSELSAASALAGTERLPVTQSSATVYATPAQIDTYISATTKTLTNKTLTSPVLTTPVLGTPASGVATNLTGTATGLTSGITNALKSATTTVDVSAATAPTNGQILTATSGTTATWQTAGAGAGDFVGPASSTDNAVVRFDSTTGKLGQNSGVIIDDSNNVSGVGTLANGTQTLTSTSANALAVGASGATNPVLQVDANTASVATGVKITGAAAAGGVTIAAISSGTDETLNINAKGGGGLNLNSGTGATALALRTNSTTRLSLSNSAYTFSGMAATATPSVRFSYVATANTSLTASTEFVQIDWALQAIQQHATGALTLNRDYRIRQSTHSAVGASTITDAVSLSVDAAPAHGTNASITNSSAYYSAGAAVGASVTNSYGLNIKANTGATNNYAFRFEGSAGELINLSTLGKFSLLATNTAVGTTGAQTIDKPSGTVNFAAAATSLVVTNALCTTSSIILGTLRTNDATARIANIVPAAGSFTINLTAAATAETSCGFLIIN